VPNFCDVINLFKASLSNINPAIVKDIATRISETSLENINDRKDKFISNVYKTRIDIRILNKKVDLSAKDKKKKNVEILQSKFSFNNIDTEEDID
jgi:hypothetical protein